MLHIRDATADLVSTRTSWIPAISRTGSALNEMVPMPVELATIMTYSSPVLTYDVRDASSSSVTRWGRIPRALNPQARIVLNLLLKTCRRQATNAYKRVGDLLRYDEPNYGSVRSICYGRLVLRFPETLKQCLWGEHLVANWLLLIPQTVRAPQKFWNWQPLQCSIVVPY